MNCRCLVCGTVEQFSSAGNFRCTACKQAGVRPPSTRARQWLDKDSAGAVVAAAIRDGLLAHPRGMACADCGGVAVEYDHRDYSKPLLVAPVCRSCNLRRGPAIPKPGSLHQMVAHGVEPYRLRRSAELLMAAMGLPTDLLSTMPAKLRVVHWRQLLPLFPTEAA